MPRLHLIASTLALAGLLASCGTVGVGIRVPIPGVGSIGIGGTSDGRISGGVSVGTGGVSVDVGASGRLPAPAPAPAASAASAPTTPARR